MLVASPAAASCKACLSPLIGRASYHDSCHVAVGYSAQQSVAAVLWPHNITGAVFQSLMQRLSVTKATYNGVKPSLC
jgi:hypothetical protein